MSGNTVSPNVVGGPPGVVGASPGGFGVLRFWGESGASDILGVDAVHLLSQSLFPHFYLQNKNL